MTPHKDIEDLAKKLHTWYLEATKELKPESFNPNAQKAYEDMTDEQRFIDRYIADQIMNLIIAYTESARQEPVGYGIEIKVNAQVMQHVMSKIKLNPKTIAKRTLVPKWLVEKWIDGSGDKYDYEVYMWKLKILASLTRRYGWAVFLIDDVSALNKGKEV